MGNLLEKIQKFHREFAGISTLSTHERTPNFLGVETEDHLIMETSHKLKKKKFQDVTLCLKKDASKYLSYLSLNSRLLSVHVTSYDISRVVPSATSVFFSVVTETSTILLPLYAISIFLKKLNIEIEWDTILQQQRT